MTLEAAVAALAAHIAPLLEPRWRSDERMRGLMGAIALDAFGAPAPERAGALERLARLVALAVVAGSPDSAYAAPRRQAPAAIASFDPARDNAPSPAAALATLVRELVPAGLPDDLVANTRAALASPADQLGPLWEGLASIGERRKAGQFYSGAEPIDLILGFCLRSPDDVALDPGCGTGAFLVRALSRLASLRQAPRRAAPVARLLGVDRDPFAIHFAAANLAARDAADYPLHAADFFAIEPGSLPPATCVIGNPPYTRQELMASKTDAWGPVEQAGHLHAAGRAGLYVPYLLHAHAFLPPGGRMGVLTPSSWLNCDYGRVLRRFLLERCRIVAIVAPGGERWFEAGVNAIILIADREDDPAVRRENLTRFVHFKRPLISLLGADAGAPDRWPAVDSLVSRIESARGWYEDADLRVLAVLQDELGQGEGGWAPEGRRARPEGGSPAETGGTRTIGPGIVGPRVRAGVIGSGKWAAYLRAPSCYFRLLERFGDRLCPLGELATIRRGLTTGANGFFYVRDITDMIDEAERAGVGRRPRIADPRIVLAGDGSRHLIEARFLAPIVTSPRELAGPILDPAQLPKRAVVLPPDRAALAGTLALEYVAWGERANPQAGQSGPPLSLRRTCAGRPRWWSLSPGAAGSLLWCKTHYTRHLAPRNPAGALADCNLYHLTPRAGVDLSVLAAVLSSTLVALLKELYGRANLGEGALKTEVIDLLAMPVPDPRLFDGAAGDRLRRALATLERRPVLGLSAELPLPDRRELDCAVLGAIGLAKGEIEAVRQGVAEGVCELLRQRTASRGSVLP